MHVPADVCVYVCECVSVSRVCICVFCVYIRLCMCTSTGFTMINSIEVLFSETVLDIQLGRQT